MYNHTYSCEFPAITLTGGLFGEWPKELMRSMGHKSSHFTENVCRFTFHVHHSTVTFFFPEIVADQNTLLYPAEALLIIIPKAPFCYGRVSSQSSPFCLLLLDLSGHTCWVLSYSRPRTYMLLVAIEIRFQISHPRFRLSLTPSCPWPNLARVHTSTHTRSFCHYCWMLAPATLPGSSLVWLHFYQRVVFSHSIIISSHQPVDYDSATTA